VNLDRGFGAVASRLAEPAGVALGSPGAVCALVGRTLISTVGGASGPLYGTVFREIGKSLGDAAGPDDVAFVAALQAGLAGVQRLGAASPATKTMVDAYAPALAALDEAVGAGQPLGTAVTGAAHAATTAPRATVALESPQGPRLLPRRTLGRPPGPRRHPPPPCSSPPCAAPSSTPPGKPPRQSLRKSRAHWAAGNHLRRGHRRMPRWRPAAHRALHERRVDHDRASRVGVLERELDAEHGRTEVGQDDDTVAGVGRGQGGTHASRLVPSRPSAVPARDRDRHVPPTDLGQQVGQRGGEPRAVRDQHDPHHGSDATAGRCRRTWRWVPAGISAGCRCGRGSSGPVAARRTDRAGPEPTGILASRCPSDVRRA